MIKLRETVNKIWENSIAPKILCGPHLIFNLGMRPVSGSSGGPSLMGSIVVGNCKHTVQGVHEVWVYREFHYLFYLPIQSSSSEFSQSASNYALKIFKIILKILFINITIE